MSCLQFVYIFYKSYHFICTFNIFMGYEAFLLSTSFNIHLMWVPLTMTWHVLGIQMEDMAFIYGR